MTLSIHAYILQSMSLLIYPSHTAQMQYLLFPLQRERMRMSGLLAMIIVPIIEVHGLHLFLNSCRIQNDLAVFSSLLRIIFMFTVKCVCMCRCLSVMVEQPMDHCLEITAQAKLAQPFQLEITFSSPHTASYMARIHFQSVSLDFYLSLCLS